MISLHRTRYISVQEHTIRRQLLAEKAFFEFSGCKHVKQVRRYNSNLCVDSVSIYVRFVFVVI